MRFAMTIISMICFNMYGKFYQQYYRTDFYFLPQIKPRKYIVYLPLVDKTVVILRCFHL